MKTTETITLSELLIELNRLANCLRAASRLAPLTQADTLDWASERLASLVLDVQGVEHANQAIRAYRAFDLYKPCRAGGGDIGAAFSYDPRALERFLTTARDRGFAPITLETATHGIDVRR